MNTYLVQPNNLTPNEYFNETVKKHYQENFFNYLSSLARESNGHVNIINKLLLTGVAVVDATDDGVEMMKKANYQVTSTGIK